MYWLCEKSNALNQALTSRKETITVGYKAVPRVCKWILTEAEKLITLIDLGKEAEVHFSNVKLEPTSEEVLSIPGLADLMDAIEAEKMQHVMAVSLETEEAINITTELPMQDEVLLLTQKPYTDVGDNAMVIELCEGIDFSTPSFSLGLTQEFKTAGAEKAIEPGNVNVGIVTTPTNELTPHRVRHDKGKECVQSIGTPYHTIELPAVATNCGTSAAAEAGMTPNTEYHTPVVVFCDKSDAGSGPTFTKLNSLDFDTAEKGTDMTLTCPKQSQMKSAVNDTVKAPNTEPEMVDMASPNTMLVERAVHIGRSLKEAANAANNEQPHTSDMMEQLQKKPALTAAKSVETTKAIDEFDDLKYRFGNLEAYAKYLEDKVDLFHNEISKHSVTDDKMINAYFAEDEVNELRKEVLVQKKRVGKLETDMERQSCLIHVLLRQLGKENRNPTVKAHTTTGSEDDVAGPSGALKKAMKACGRKRERTVLEERDVNAGQR